MGKTYQSIVLSESPDEVWGLLRNFHDLSWAKNVVQKEEAVGEKGATEVGAKRVLNDLFHETLIEFDDEGRMLRYSIDDAPGTEASAENVSDYVGTLRVVPVTEGEGTFVEWYSKWRGNDEACEAFCHPIYAGLLADLRRHFGS